MHPAPEDVPSLPPERISATIPSQAQGFCMRSGLIGQFFAGVIGTMVLAQLSGCKKQPPAQPAPPATRPSTAPVARAPTTQYVDVIRAIYPKYPATQPLKDPVEMRDAGHFVVPDPLYLDIRGDLWITSADAPPLTETLKDAADHQVHIVPHPIEFVQWATDPDTGKWLARVVVREQQATSAPASSPTTMPATAPSTGATASDAWIDPTQTHPTTPGRRYRWRDAIYMNDQVVVPTDRGVSVFSFSPEYKEEYHDVVSQPGHSLPRVVTDSRGFIAFSPWESMKYGSDGAIRYTEGTWTRLAPDAPEPDQKWPGKLLHVVPLLDGSALEFYREQPGGPVKLGVGVLDAPTVDEKKIEDLVNQLSDEDPAKRKAAYEELQRYGTGSWSVLARLQADQPPEARIRIEQLLANRSAPTLGGRKPLGGVMELTDRFADGGILLYLPGGVSIPQPIPDKPPDIVKPAWISIRPGRAIELLDPVLTRDAQPDKQHFFAYGNEWIVSDPVQGPRRLAGNHLEPLLHKDESAFDDFVGFDSRGRWLFRKSGTQAPTLIVDPTLPDPTPRLPVWQMWVEKGSVGWSRQGYPVIKRGGAWALYEDGWHPLPKDDQMITSIPPRPRSPRPLRLTPAPATSNSTTTPSATGFFRTTASTTPASTSQSSSSRPLGSPILVDADGTEYFGGKQFLRVVRKTGAQIDWQLPAEAVGSRRPTLIRTFDGKLFLFNEPGRVVRISPTPDKAEPFQVDAIFTHRIPQSDDMQRIWLDPAGRIIMAYQHDHLAILFPAGRIPPEMLLLIPANELDDGK
jgi:hypothetical protein